MWDTLEWYKLMQVMPYVIEVNGKPVALTFCYRHRDPRSALTRTLGGYPYAMEVLLLKN